MLRSLPPRLLALLVLVLTGALAAGCAAPERRAAASAGSGGRRGPAPAEETVQGYALAHLAHRGVEPRTVHVACAAPRADVLERGAAYAPLAVWAVDVTVTGRGARATPEPHVLWLVGDELLASEGPSERGRPLRTYYPAYDRRAQELAAGAEPEPVAEPAAAAAAPVSPPVDELPGASALSGEATGSADPLDGVWQGMSLAGVRTVLGPPVSDVNAADGTRRLVYGLPDGRGGQRNVTLIFRAGRLFATPGGTLRPAGRVEPVPAPPTIAERAVARLRPGLALEAVRELLGEPLRERVDGSRREVIFQFSETGSRAGATQYVTVLFEDGRLASVPGYPLSAE